MGGDIDSNFHYIGGSESLSAISKELTPNGPAKDGDFFGIPIKYISAPIRNFISLLCQTLRGNYAQKLNDANPNPSVSIHFTFINDLAFSKNKMQTEGSTSSRTSSPFLKQLCEADRLSRLNEEIGRRLYQHNAQQPAASNDKPESSQPSSDYKTESESPPPPSSKTGSSKSAPAFEANSSTTRGLSDFEEKHNSINQKINKLFETAKSRIFESGSSGTLKKEILATDKMNLRTTIEKSLPQQIQKNRDLLAQLNRKASAREASLAKEIEAKIARDEATLISLRSHVNSIDKSQSQPSTSAGSSPHKPEEQPATPAEHSPQKPDEQPSTSAESSPQKINEGVEQPSITEID